MTKLSPVLLAVALLVSASAVPAYADEGRWHGDIHQFHEHDYDHWRGGRWFNGFHDGRSGWWWIVDDGWYFYPTPVYPYPDPYTPPMVVTTPVPVAPVGVPPSYVYYCKRPAGYYPYVAQCFGHWHRVVAATVPAAPPVVQQPPMVVAPSAQPMPAPQTMAPAGGQREADDRQLNAYAVEFDRVDLKNHHAKTILRQLEQKVEAFRQALYSRSYNAMDILRDADNLEHRIAAQREKLSGHIESEGSPMLGAPPPNAAMAPPPVSSAPPLGFPPQ